MQFSVVRLSLACFVSSAAIAHGGEPRRLCHKNADCASRWCQGGTWWSSGDCLPQRHDGERAEGGWPSYDYNVCYAGNGICGYCGLKQPTDRKCTSNSDCESNWCQGRGSCAGRCKARRSDGQRAEGSWPSYDYNVCLAGNGICGVCGLGAADGQTCTSNSDCRSTWCEGRGSCAGKCAPLKNDGESVHCNDVLSVTAGGCDYNRCRAKAGKCGVCGNKVRDGHQCSENSDCTSGACRMGNGIISSSVFCGGKCVPKQPDGKTLPRLNYPTMYNGAASFYDYSECRSNTGICGTCGQRMPKEAVCSLNTDCGEGLCCDAVVGVNCGGRCVTKTPAACPSLLTPAGLKNAAKRSVDYAKKFAQCMKDELMPPPDDDGGHKFGCLFKAYVENSSFALRCKSLDGEKSRRLAAIDTTNRTARKLGYTSHTEAASTPPVRLAIGERFVPKSPPATNFLGEAPKNMSRRLFTVGLGSSEEPKTKVLGCKKSQLCEAGASFSYYADVQFTPQIFVQFDGKKQEASISLSGVLEAEIGALALAGGECSKEWTTAYPEAPKPIVTACFYVLCIAVSVQAQASLSLDGKVNAHASAVFKSTYQVRGEVKVHWTDDSLGTDQGNGLQLTRESENWALNAYGSFGASVKASVGPVLTIAVTPGVFVSVNPYLTGEMQMFGDMAYSKSSPGGTNIATSAKWPTEIECPAKDAPQKKSSFGKRKDSKGSGLSLASGDGFKVEAGSAVDHVGENHVCLAAGIMVLPGVRVSGVGPPVTTEPKEMLNAICQEAVAQMHDIKKVGAEAAITMSALDCTAKQMGTDGLDGFLNNACEKITDLIPSLSEFNVKFGSAETCIDIWTDHLGSDACLQNVGCQSRPMDTRLFALPTVDKPLVEPGPQGAMAMLVIAFLSCAAIAAVVAMGLHRFPVRGRAHDALIELSTGGHSDEE